MNLPEDPTSIPFRQGERPIPPVEGAWSQMEQKLDFTMPVAPSGAGSGAAAGAGSSGADGAGAGSSGAAAAGAAASRVATIVRGWFGHWAAWAGIGAAAVAAVVVVKLVFDAPRAVPGSVAASGSVGGVRSGAGVPTGGSADAGVQSGGSRGVDAQSGGSAGAGAGGAAAIGAESDNGGTSAAGGGSAGGAISGTTAVPAGGKTSAPGGASASEGSAAGGTTAYGAAPGGASSRKRVSGDHKRTHSNPRGHDNNTSKETGNDDIATNRGWDSEAGGAAANGAGTNGVATNGAATKDVMTVTGAARAGANVASIPHTLTPTARAMPGSQGTSPVKAADSLLRLAAIKHAAGTIVLRGSRSNSKFRRIPRFSAGIALKQYLPLPGQQFNSYSAGGTKSIYSDYIPAVFFRAAISRRSYLQASVGFSSPQFTRDMVIDKENLRNSNVSGYAAYLEFEQGRLKKLFYNEADLTYHYQIADRWRAGVGIQFAKLYGGTVESQTILQPANPALSDTVYATQILGMKRTSGYYQTVNQRTEWRGVVEVEYCWMRWMLGLRYQQAFGPFYFVLNSTGNEHITNGALSIRASYTLWERERR